MCFALIDLSELLNTRDLDAAAIFKNVLQFRRIILLGLNLFIISWMTPLELYPIWLAYYLRENSLPREHWFNQIKLLLLVVSCLGHQDNLFLSSFLAPFTLDLVFFLRPPRCLFSIFDLFFIDTVCLVYLLKSLIDLSEANLAWLLSFMFGLVL